MGQVNLAGILSVGTDTSKSVFPAAETTIPLIATTSDYAVSSPAGLMSIVSLSTFVPIQGVGTNGPVTRGLFLYLKTDAEMVLRVTTQTTSAAQVLPINGLVILEFQPDDALTLLEIKGSGRVEYLVAGQI